MTLTNRPGILIQALLWISIAAFGIYFLMNIRKYVNFGIDLVGGTYLTLEVHTEEALRNELLEKVNGFVTKLEQEGYATPLNTQVQNVQAHLVFSTPQEALKAFSLLQSYDSLLEVSQDGNALKVVFSQAAQKKLSEEAVDGNINVLRSRLDQMGAGEVTIAAQGDKRILIELPNVKDINEAKGRIGKTALLEIKPIEDMAISEQALIEKYDGNLPEGMMIVTGVSKEASQEPPAYLVSDYAEITGRMLADAQPDIDQHYIEHGSKSPYYVKITFKKDAVDRWHDLTGRIAEAGNTGAGTGMLGMILDNKVIQAAGVKKAIDSAEVMLSGSMTPKETEEIALLLRSGSFTARVSFAEERTIGPSLGSESIRQGLLACGIALILLFFFSIGFYKTAGLLAFVVLLYNLLLILFGLWRIEATLTLPGIAGMVLTIGMAIDSSILIFEKIKEELAAGLPVRQAVDKGFSGVLGVILDANITTFIVAFVLYMLGSGPIQGFAITMMIGIVSTLITGIILLKFLFRVLFDVIGLQKVKI